MAIRGSLGDASLADVLQLLALGQKTGCLSVTHRQRFGYIYFDRGRICHASIVNRRDRLGDALVRDGLVARAELDAAIARQRSEPDRRLGELLLDAGAIDEDRLREYVRAQLEEAVYYLLTWTHGTFNFEVDVRPDAREVLASINPEALLLEGARRIDEWGLIEKKIPSFDLVYDLDRPRVMEHAPALTPEQIAVAGLLDGRRDVAAIVEESGLSEFEVGKALYALLTAGFLHKIGRTRAPEAVPTEQRVAEYRNLAAAFFRAGMLDDALRELQRILELKPNDEPALFQTGLVHLRQERWEDAARAFRDGARSPHAPLAVHHNLAYALERQGRFGEARAALQLAIRAGGGSDPQVRTTAGVLALQLGEVGEADTALTEAAALWGGRDRPAAWFHYAALAAALNGDSDRAIALLAEGVKTYPHAAVLLNNLAVALERRGRHTDALAAAERAVLDAAGLPQLQKNLGDYYYRAGRYDEAFDAYQRALKPSPSIGPDAHVKLGNIFYRRGDHLEATRCWERALEIAPGNAAARNNLETVRRIRA